MSNIYSDSERKITLHDDSFITNSEVYDPRKQKNISSSSQS